MKTALETILLLSLIGTPVAAEQPPAQGRAKAPSPSTVVDKDGKKKVVQQTPFGPSMKEAPPEGLDPANGRPRQLTDNPMLKIEEKGDVVTFRRTTPFGEQVWQRKRSELNAAEQEMIAARKKTLETQAAKPAAPRTESK